MRPVPLEKASAEPILKDMKGSSLLSAFRLLPVSSVLLMLIGGMASAQPTEGMCPGCPGMGGGMWIGMALVALLVVAAIAALVALTVYLVRKSKPPGPPREA